MYREFCLIKQIKPKSSEKEINNIKLLLKNCYSTGLIKITDIVQLKSLKQTKISNLKQI